MQDPNNKELADQRMTMFMGETLRGMLLNAWGWGTIGTIATIGGIVLILIGLRREARAAKDAEVATTA
jgi:hypothetical protein